MASLADVLARETRDGELYDVLPDGRLRCYACGHQCPLPEGAIGVCKVRFNEGGRLRVPWGYVGGVQCDPIEKKPFFHAYPGALAYSFGMLGCDLHCAYCQNWVTSQALRDPAAVSPPMHARAEEMVEDAVRRGARVLVSTYNEPLITAEWAVEIFKHAKAAGLVTGFVSNGNGTPQVLEYLRPWIDLYKVDLKSFDDRHYRQLGGRLDPILDTIRRLHAMDVWVEIVTLLIPGFNDSADELTRLTEFIASVSPDIPWHVTAFHADYKMDDTPNTTPAMLRQAAEIGRASGLHFVYAGNLPGSVGNLEDTRCTSCGGTLIARSGFRIRDYRVTPNGCCPSCGTSVPGRFERTLRRAAAIGSCGYKIKKVITDTLGRPLRNLRLSVTDRCNLRCEYCMPEDEYQWLPREDLLHFEEISPLVDIFIAEGVDRIRLTGGEPLLRRDLPKLVEMISAKPGLHDLAMTTNGILLADHVDALAAAGLKRMTVSLDTLHADRFKALTRSDELPRVHEGMQAAQRVFPAGFKIDTVVIKGVNDDELADLIEYGKSVGAEVRFIEYMDVGGATKWSPANVMSRAEMLAMLSTRYGTITPIVEESSAPADRYQLADGTVFGIISSTTQPFCSNCDRSRLTADGMWYLCLYATRGVDLRAALRAGVSRDHIAAMIRGAWQARDDRGAEQRLELGDRRAFVPVKALKKDPHLEMHTRGG